MLTRELAIAAYETGRIIPDRLSRQTHAHYLPIADSMLEVYRLGVGKTRSALHQSVCNLFPDSAEFPPRRIKSFCKLLDDASEFDRGTGKKVAQLRQSVFRQAAKHHPLVSVKDSLFDSQESDVKQVIAATHEMDWPKLHRLLFSDLIENHRLESFRGYENSAALLARYNVAQVQASLYDAIQMTVQATTDFKQILRYAKLARLMHRISRKGESYIFEFDGPASLKQNTHRYGIAMARFLPGLLACRGWSLTATMRSQYSSWLRLELNDRCGLTSAVQADDSFDSSIESMFCHEWGEQPREGWTIERETEILHRGQTVFFPDFVFKHPSGRRVLMEIIGFWTPEYLAQKSAVLHTFANEPILLAVAHSVRERLVLHADASIIEFNKKLAVESVQQALAKMVIT